MKKLLVALVGLLAFYTSTDAQIIGERLTLNTVYTFESEAAPNAFISYGNDIGNAAFNATNRNFKVIAPFNGKKGFVSLQAVDIPGEAYLMMGDGCPRPYTASNYYKIGLKPTHADATFNQNASFEVLSGNSDRQNSGLVSFRVKNGTHFLKNERGSFMDAPGGGVAPRYQNQFTFKITPVTKSTLSAGATLNTGEKLVSENGEYMLTVQTDGNLCIYKKENGTHSAFIWCSMATGFPNGKVAMQADGNLVVTDANNVFRWGSYQAKQHSLEAGATAVLTNDGKLTVVNPNGKVLWVNQ